MDSAARSLLDRVLTDAPDADRRAAGTLGAPGLLSRLLGARRGVAGHALLVGGVAALGKIALDAWGRAGEVATDPTIGAVEGDAAEERAHTLLFAIVAAAKADGHIDEEEHSAIDAEIEDLPPVVKGLLGEAIAAAPDPEAVAARVRCGQEAREVYAASALICGRDHPLEVDYLDRLARALDLSSEEARRIEGDVLAHV